MIGVKIGTAMITLVALSAPASAWEAKAYYPSAIVPEMPSAEEAVRLTAQPPALLRPLRHAHREARHRGWIGVPSFDRTSLKRPVP